MTAPATEETLGVWILGTSGQARETRDLLRRTSHDVAGRPLELRGMLGPDDEQQLEEEHGALLLGVGFPELRAELWHRFSRVGRFSFPTLVHPDAEIGGGSRLEDGVVVSKGCVVTTDVVVGAGTVLNPRSGVGHDSVVGRCCVVNPGANISGSVRVGDEVLVGSGATILQGITLGDRARIGAGAVVTKDVAAGVTVVGVPARPAPADRPGGAARDA